MKGFGRGNTPLRICNPGYRSFVLRIRPWLYFRHQNYEPASRAVLSN